MSWYFFGGFSAYFSVPSGRRWNQSGCSISQGWSAEHWIAKSSAISSRARRASFTNRSNSSTCRGRHAWRCARRRLVADRPWAARDRRGARRRVVATLAVRPSDRVHGRQVERRRSRAREPGSSFSTPFEAAPRAREELVPGAERRTLAVGRDLEHAVAHGLLGAVAGLSPRGLPRRSAPAPPSSAAPSDSSLARSLCPAATLRSSSRCHEATRSTHAHDAELPAPERIGRERAVPAIGILRERAHRRLTPAARPGRPVAQRARRAPRGRRARSSPTPRRGRRPRA